ncbi:MAG: hypothetical protein SW833_08995 [Cyanobacteriota bacterium]|nr:hypothetical protein [Cyanobacteriota bacterium]
MTQSTTTATGTKTASKAEYLNLVCYSRKFSAEDIFFTEAGIDYPDLYEAAVNLLDNGETAWDTPEFEECLYQIFCGWAKEGRLERIALTADWLVRTTDGDTRQWLEDFVEGRFYLHLADWELREKVLGSPENYLYPLQFHLLIASQRQREVARAELDQRSHERLCS